MTPNFSSGTIWTGNNLPILRDMNSATVDLIYLDPPFNSNRTYSAPIGSQAAGAAFKDAWTFDDADRVYLALLQERDPTTFAIIEAARLAHGKGMAAYLGMMAQRLTEMRRVLRETGSLYLHCDPTASHYLKMLLDSLFGHGQFVNEIVWTYGLGGSSKRAFSKKHDCILFYSKTKEYTFDKPLVRATSQRMKGEMKGMLDTWSDIPSLNNQSKERTKYPTQKPLALLDRIIRASSNEGDMVLDPFCGSGTTLVAAARLGRQWAGIDLSPQAVKLAYERIGLPIT